LQSFLLGQDEFYTLLQSPGLEQFRQRVIASYHLGPLTRNETRDYIEHRLKLCGWQNDPEFLDDAFTEIFDATSGIPRRLNLLADRILLHCCVEELHRVDGAVVRTVSEEARQEFPMQDTGVPGEAGESEQPDSDGVGVADNVQPLHPANTVSNAERRLIALEKKVGALEKTLRRDRRRMQRVITLLTHPDEDDETTASNIAQNDIDKAEW
jgi:hypothetical protein